MQFFKHMSNMRHDPKVKRLIRRYKANGYAVYVMVLESIAEGISTDSPLPVLEDNVQDLAYELGIPETEIEDIVAHCSKEGLLQIINEAGVVYCVKIYKYLNTSQTRSERLRQMISHVSGKSGTNLLFNDIKNEIEHTILLEYKDLKSIPIMSETVYDNCDRREREEKENITEREIDKDVSKQTFSHYTGKKDKPPTKNIFTEITEYWNEKVPDQATPFTALNMSLSGDIIVLLEQTDIQVVKTAIDHYGKAYEHNKYRVAGFTNFMTMKNIESWYPESSVENRKPEDVKEEEDKPVFEKGKIKWN